MMTMSIAMMMNLLNDAMVIKNGRLTIKLKIKKGLLPIAWRPDHVMDWCMS